MFRTRILPASLLSALFVLALGGFLPDPVASHFDASGVRNAFASRASVVAIMALTASLVPALMWLLPACLIRVRGGAFVNLPNRELWFSPEHVGATHAFLDRHFACFSYALNLFFCYAFALVVQANREAGGRLSSSALLMGEAVLLGYLVLWLVHLYRIPFHTSPPA